MLQLFMNSQVWIGRNEVDSFCVHCPLCVWCVQLASTIYARQKIQPMNPYASNWLERLRRVRHMRDRLTTERAKSEGPVDSRSSASTPRPVTGDDFSDFVKWSVCLCVKAWNCIRNMSYVYSRVALRVFCFWRTCPRKFVHFSSSWKAVYFCKRTTLDAVCLSVCLSLSVCSSSNFCGASLWRSVRFL